MATKKPKAKKIKTPTPAKPKKVTIMDTELDRLRMAEKTLGELIAAKKAADQLEMEYELAKDETANRKGAMQTAKLHVNEIIEAWSRPLPLFDQKAKPAEKAAIPKAPVGTCLGPVMVEINSDGEHGIPAGTLVEVLAVKPGGLRVSSNGYEADVAIGEYQATAEVMILTDDAREQKIVGHDAWLDFVASQQPAAPAAVNEDWKTLPLDAAGINGKGGKLLSEAGYETLGSVQKLMNDCGQWWPKEIKGIGEETAAGIADKFVDFFAAHPEYCQPQAVA